MPGLMNLVSKRFFSFFWKQRWLYSYEIIFSSNITPGTPDFFREWQLSYSLKSLIIIAIGYNYHCYIPRISLN